MNFKFSRQIRYTTLLLLVAGAAFAQTTANKVISNYSANETFSPLFYSTNGNEFRSASGIPGPKYWQNRADYQLNVSLDEVQKKISGSVTITYRNNSPDRLPFLWLQLDQNSFKANSRSNALIVGASRFGGQGEKFNGGYHIKQLRVQQKGKDVKFSQLVEDTRMQIRLAQPLAAHGDVITITIAYEYVLPKNGSDRTGYVATKNGDIFAIAQWFPRMSVYDDILGWNTLPYWGAGEFYCEFGDIQFSVTAPANHIVMGSGELLNPQEVFTAEQLKRWNAAKNSDTTVHIRTEAEVTDPKSRPAKAKLTWKYRMNNTRDAAWASSSAFVLDAARIKLPSGKNALAVSAHPVESNGKNSYGRAVEYVKASVEHYSEKWFEYPYPMAVNIASSQNGMEYPGIVFCGMDAKKGDVWNVIDHEFGHTWFPMIVGSNERKYAWMDEGFNTFINGLSAKAFNKGEYANEGALEMFFAEGLIRTGKMNTLLMTLPDAMSEMQIAINAYLKPGWGLDILRDEVMGEDRFDYAFKQYISAWAYKHPSPYDFFRSMENAAGEDLSWFWRGWILNNWLLDQAITEVKEIKKDGAISAYQITLANLEKMAMPVHLLITTRSGKEEHLKLPVDIWMKGGTHQIRYPVTEEIASVVLDPDYKLPDMDKGNNKWPLVVNNTESKK